MKKLFAVVLLLSFAFNMCSCQIFERKCEHVWKSATCTTPQTCNLCGEIVGVATGHTKVVDKSSTPTCTKTGRTEGAHCSACGEILIAQDVISVVGHSYKDGMCVWCKTMDPKEKQIKSASTAYEHLVVAETLCVESMVTIYAAWYFSIYEADRYKGTQARFDAFVDTTELDYGRALNALNAEIMALGLETDGMTQFAALNTQAVCIKTAIRAIKANNTFTQIEEHLSLAKKELDTLTSQYEFYTSSQRLRTYYSKLKEYYEFIGAPYVTFEEVDSIIDNYHSVLEAYRKELKVLFD